MAIEFNWPLSAMVYRHTICQQMLKTNCNKFLNPDAKRASGELRGHKTTSAVTEAW